MPPAPRREGAGVRKRKLQKRKEKLNQRRLNRLALMPSLMLSSRASGSTTQEEESAASLNPPEDQKKTLTREEKAVKKAAKKAAKKAKAAALPAVHLRQSPRLQAMATTEAIPALDLNHEPPQRLNEARSNALPAFVPPPWELQYDLDSIERQLQPLVNEPVLGVDVEWRPTFVSGAPRNRIALVQVASRTRCVLVPVRHLARLPPTLARLLGNPDVWKVGCGVAEDALKLQTDCGLNCHPILEIGRVATRLQACEGFVFPALSPGEKVRPGLAGLALACGYELTKPKSVSRSNWERRPLTAQQQRYAALDAYSSVWIAMCMHALHSRCGAHGGLARWCGDQHQLLCGGRNGTDSLAEALAISHPGRSGNGGVDVASTAMPTAERVVHQQSAPSSEASRKRKRRSGKKML
jgi:hypothetical protein